MAISSLTRGQRRTEQTRARLLDAARAVFLAQGYDGASTGAITEHADLGAGTFYLHFRDKRGLYEAVVRRELLVLRARWLAARESRPRSAGPVAEISLMVEMVLEALLAEPDMARLVLLDGPPLETWLADEIGLEMARVLGPQFADPGMTASLVIGATLSAARRSLLQPRRIATARLVASAVSFCAGGVSAMQSPKTKARP
jgi:AcrR family transcriptional regulator